MPIPHSSSRLPTQVPSNSNQLRMRNAVAALKERLLVRVASQVFKDGRVANTRVVVDGEFYDVNQYELAKLRQGLAPADLDLEPADCGEDC